MESDSSLQARRRSILSGKQPVVSPSLAPLSLSCASPTRATFAASQFSPSDVRPPSLSPPSFPHALAAPSTFAAAQYSPSGQLLLLPLRRRCEDSFCPSVTATDATENRKRRRLCNMRRLYARIAAAASSAVSPDRPDPSPPSREYVSYLKATYSERSYYGGPDYECDKCGAIFWFQERSPSRSCSRRHRIIYNTCCRGGADVDSSINTGGGPYVFRINGVVHHRIGSLMPQSGRLSFHFFNQDALRSDTYQGISDAVSQGASNGRNIGTRVVLPASFTGSRRYYILNYQDAMAICRQYGAPDIFHTFTCNSKWPEIADALRCEPTQACSERPDIITRVFHMKLDEYMSDVKNGYTFGPICAVLYTIEFQKRGLPHVHTLTWLLNRTREPSAELIDGLISAEIPDLITDPLGYALVEEFMMHGPCGDFNTHCPCMKDGVCSKRYPKSFNAQTVIDESGFPVYRRRDDGRFILKNGVRLDNRSVVPYNMTVLKKYQAHINVEWCNKTNLVKYLFKYLTKGQDRARVAFRTSDQQTEPSNSDGNHGVDEIAEYIRCR